MRKIVINTCYGGFSLSPWALLEYGKAHGTPPDEYEGRELHRDDPALVQIVESDARRASGSLAALRVVSIPDDVDWIIEEYDGREWVAEQHRKWYWVEKEFAYD